MGLEGSQYKLLVSDEAINQHQIGNTETTRTSEEARFLPSHRRPRSGRPDRLAATVFVFGFPLRPANALSA